MSDSSFDIVTVGGGIGGSSLAFAMAAKGARVLVIERDREFRDRVRGEALLPWGVGEARQLGIYDLLKKTCAHEQPWFDFHLGPMQLVHRNLPETTPQAAAMCNFYHPKMQETIIAAAAEAGAVVKRGAVVADVRPGSQPSLTYEHDGKGHEVHARMIVAADGRVSPARKWSGFTVQHDPPTLALAGILFDDVAVAEDAGYLLMNPMLYQGAFIFPQGGGRARVYLAYPVGGNRLQGVGDIPRFIEELARTGAPREFLSHAKPAGPLASFEAADTWAPHPYNNGVALVGDAASSSDPSWGNGLSLTLRDVRVLRDRLLANENWDTAGHEYAEEHDRGYSVIHHVTTWGRQLFMESGPDADARRAKALPLIGQDPTRFPDHGVSGPDIPFDREVTRARFFGEC